MAILLSASALLCAASSACTSSATSFTNFSRFLQSFSRRVLSGGAYSCRSTASAFYCGLGFGHAFGFGHHYERCARLQLLTCLANTLGHSAKPCCDGYCDGGQPPHQCKASNLQILQHYLSVFLSFNPINELGLTLQGGP